MSTNRRLSTSSSSSGSSSPGLTGLDSTSALILVPDEDDTNSPFDFSSDEEDDDPQFESRRASIPPLAPSSVFLYLLSPFLKLGAMFLPNAELPLKYAIPPLLLFSVLSAFARQIWYMLARYLRKSDMEDIVLDAFARGRGKERRRTILRSIVRAGTGSLRILLATVYLRESVHAIVPLLPQGFILPPSLAVTMVFALAIIPLSAAQSLASKRVIYVTWLSIVTYLVWLSCVAYAHTQGTLGVDAGWLRMGSFWQGITATAFAFTSSSTLPLYASLKGSYQPVTTAKTSKSRSFRILSSLSVAVAVLLILPLIFFSAHPNAPVSKETPGSRLQPFIVSLHAITLLLSVPTLLITTPPLPIPERVRRSTTISLSKSAIFIMVVLLSLVPPAVSAVLSDILLFSALSSAYFLPALVHITTHFFKKPLSIVMPPHVPSPSHPAARLPDGPSTPISAHDELLQRKERALQRRQLRKRIIWDIGVWVLLLPVGGGGFLWAGGRLAGRW